jgi:hypothetical protein
MSIKRCSTVTNIVDINATSGYQPITIAAGSTLTVYKVKRNGHIYCHSEQYRFATIITIKDNLKEVTQSNPVKVNDIFYTSWGYDQTNIDFYMVVDITKSSVKVVSLGSDRTYTGSMQGTCVPNLNTKGTDIMTKRINIYNNKPSFKIASYATAWPYDNTPMNFSEWA